MHPARTRRITTISISTAALALTVGTAAPAWADPGNGNGNGNGAGNGNAPTVPPGQAKKVDPTPAPTTTKAPPPAPAPTATHVPPGQAKKSGSNAAGNSAGNAAGNGKASAPGQLKKAADANNDKGHGKGKGANGPDGHNPPGNNGTVKIHALPGDTGHHNVPHPGCSFVVDFWGFDAGQTLTVAFTGQAPTGAGTPLSLSGSGTSITSTDDAGGGNDFDGELVYRPTAAELAVLGAPGPQGYHVKLDVSTGAPGGHKYKVFWISPCTPPAPPTPVATPLRGTDTVEAGIPDAPTITSDTMTAVRTSPSPSVPELDTARVTRTTPRLTQASPPISSLPFTGADVGDLIAAGVVATAAGIGLTVASRRRRRHLG
jgi:hypothetical protein